MKLNRYDPEDVPTNLELSLIGAESVRLNRMGYIRKGRTMLFSPPVIKLGIAMQKASKEL